MNANMLCQVFHHHLGLRVSVDVPGYQLQTNCPLDPAVIYLLLTAIPGRMPIRPRFGRSSVLSRFVHRDRVAHLCMPD